ncbi:Leucine Rich repeats (2 copies) [Rubripirellula lacrimiformis]|uniref:Leucine Rich repeats (2 copies) n=1 Tax=Rubripirellula lacrimiformis TaxID=1930273 RepID=A0A517N5I2_9BACT|nr:hypothetical protein [Rubripirellula lacrimiformis]QDT02385.1 Leucine Rich repeats (2 copies) [Rubripirellula lacrimiformis]
MSNRFRNSVLTSVAAVAFCMGWIDDRSTIGAEAQVPADSDSDQAAPLDAEAIQAAVDKLTSRQFLTRQTAFEKLISSGDAAIDALQHAALVEDLETSARCIDALIQIAKNEDSKAAVLAAMKKIADQAESDMSSVAAKQVELLSMTNEELAIRKLESYGERIVRRADTPMLSLTITKEKSIQQLRHFPNLRMVSLSGPMITDNALLQLTDLPSLNTLSIRNTSITSDAFAHLEKSRSLRGLMLDDRVIDESLVASIGKIPALQTLTLQTRIGEIELGYLEKLPKLTTLSLSEVILSQPGVDSLNRLRQIGSISISISDANDEECAHIAKLELPVSLSLKHSLAISVKGWDSIGKSSAQKLSVYRCGFDDDSLQALSANASMESISISKSAITDEGLKHLHGNQSLKSLFLRETSVTRDGADQLLTALPNVRYIHFNGTSMVGGRGTAPAFARPKSRNVSFTNIPPQTHKSAHLRNKIDDSTINTLKAEPRLGTVFAVYDEPTDQELAKLKDLSMTGLVIKSESISSQVLGAFNNHPSIAEVTLRSSKITDQAIDDLLLLPALTRVSLHDSQITDVGIQRLIDGLAQKSQIRWLELSGCEQLTNDAFADLARLNGLQQIFLNDNPGLTSQVFGEVGKVDSISEIRFGGASVDPADIDSISDLALDRIHFANSKLTDDVLRKVAEAFPDLTQIGLSESDVSDDAMKSLAKLAKLEWIFMHGTPVTEVGLQHLSPLQHLKYVYASRSQIGPEAVKQFHQQHPGTNLQLH